MKYSIFCFKEVYYIVISCMLPIPRSFFSVIRIACQSGPTFAHIRVERGTAVYATGKKALWGLFVTSSFSSSRFFFVFLSIYLFFILSVSFYPSINFPLCYLYSSFIFDCYVSGACRSQWPRGLRADSHYTSRFRSVAERHRSVNFFHV